MYDENKKYGYINIYRSMLDWEWYTDTNTKVLFLHCLLKANHKSKRYRGTLIERGSFVTSYDLLERETGLSIQNIRTSLKKLELTHELTCEKTQKGTIISIKNYDTYQQANTLTNTQLTNNQQTTNTQLTTNNKVNKVNKENNGGAHQYTADFLEFYESYRKAGFKDDCYEFWVEMEYTEEEKKHIVFAAKEYSHEMKDDVRHMVFPRTFLKDEIWKRYEFKKEDDWRKRQQEQIEYMRSMGVDV